eukprot:CAMPEP_0172794812 /NCGR_PEP_ID=MMETSP1074-20121228/210166_1 /TAXON_ID=2916 /ORGANISM="Ceratium fusus, Strain PA161109" /LENGTH=162 /DNA_ID=CAMNT_0013631891 /DNA_START=759 /DNA_END=1248 /DNA_ORIENTATION=-
MGELWPAKEARTLSAPCTTCAFVRITPLHPSTPRVIGPNYLGARTNCLEASSLYAVASIHAEARTVTMDLVFLACTSFWTDAKEKGKEVCIIQTRSIHLPHCLYAHNCRAALLHNQIHEIALICRVDFDLEGSCILGGPLAATEAPLKEARGCVAGLVPNAT